jgi:hypothetical protein
MAGKLLHAGHPVKTSLQQFLSAIQPLQQQAQNADSKLVVHCAQVSTSAAQPTTCTCGYCTKTAGHRVRALIKQMQASCCRVVP